MIWVIAVGRGGDPEAPDVRRTVWVTCPLKIRANVPKNGDEAVDSLESVNEQKSFSSQSKNVSVPC